MAIGIKTVLIAVVWVVLLLSAAYADRSMPMPGGRGYVLCKESFIVFNQRSEVTQCLLAAPLTYDVYGGTEVCPENATVKFNYKGRVAGCSSGWKKSKR
ncbi:MAG: hypothetical protein HQK96_02725 [Nitrospirae bacterium]|nr:hypothetical protein [Nitrospirota bacterium]